MSTQNHPHLFASGNIANTIIKNRLVVAPMTRVSAGPKGIPTDQMAAYYSDYIKGGFGLIISEGTYPDDKKSQGYHNQPGIVTDEQVAAWSKVTKAVHDEGGLIFIQLMHAGAMSQYFDETVGPTKIQYTGTMAPNYIGEGAYPVPKELSVDEIEQIVKDFAASATRAVEAGFDGIEIHGANGYILDQFTAPETNQREDQYGGSLENRMRLHGEVMAAVKQAVAGRVPVGMRTSQVKVNDRTYKWGEGVKHARALFGALADAGADFIHINAPPGNAEVFDTGKTMARLCRDDFNGQIITCGMMSDPAVADKLVASGDSDFIANARAALADQAYPKKIAANETPIAFDMGMTSPMANLDNTQAWRDAQEK